MPTERKDVDEFDDRLQVIELKPTTDLAKRIEALGTLFEKAEARVLHSDLYRQRNMNYSLLLFAGMITFRTSLHDGPARWALSGSLLLLMVVLCIWDRRWHRTKHGWESTGKICYDRIARLTMDPNQVVRFPRYHAKAEKRAEWFSWQPIFFYLLILGAIGSFFVG